MEIARIFPWLRPTAEKSVQKTSSSRKTVTVPIEDFATCLNQASDPEALHPTKRAVILGSVEELSSLLEELEPKRSG